MELRVAEITARTFYLGEAGLLPVRVGNLRSNGHIHYDEEPDPVVNAWRHSSAKAFCKNCFISPSEDKACKNCGLYSFRKASIVAQQYPRASLICQGVIEPSGAAMEGSLGYRSQYAKLLALWVNPLLPHVFEFGNYSVESIREQYPDVVVYTSLGDLFNRYKEIDDGSGVAGYFNEIPSIQLQHMYPLQSPYHVRSQLIRINKSVNSNSGLSRRFEETGNSPIY